MSRVVWNADGLRLFETGVDRGVLFVGDEPGVPWNGLTGVNEAYDGGEPAPYYIDGYKYLNLSRKTEFGLTVTALTSPPKFGVCEGFGYLRRGLSIDEQYHEPFNFSYRTLVGNDTLGTNYAYKIHLLYNALATPTSRSNVTLNNVVTPNVLSWTFSSKPERFSQNRSSSHLVVQSRDTSAVVLGYLEALLYGTDDTTARFPNTEDLDLLFSWETVEFSFPVFVRGRSDALPPLGSVVTPGTAYLIDQNLFVRGFSEWIDVGEPPIPLGFS